MVLNILLPVVSALHLLLGVLVIIKNPKARNNRFFAAVGLLGAIWTAANYMTGIRPYAFWLESTYALGALVTATVLLWVLAFTDKEIRISRFLVIGASALLFFSLSFRDGFLASRYDEIFIGGAFTGETAYGLVLYTIFYLVAAVIILTKLYLAQRNATDLKEKLQFNYTFYGVLFALSISALTSFILPLFSIFDFGGMDSLGLLVFLTFLFFGITRSDLFNLKVVAAELIVFSIWIFLFIRIILADSVRDRFIDGGLLLLVIFFGILLIRTVLQEVRSREEISRLADELRKANSDLRKLDQLKSEFVSLASHQLRTPLTVIKGYISLIQEGSFGTISDTLGDALRKIYFSNERLINLVGDFLNLSRIESGKMKYFFEASSIEELLESVYDEFKEVVKEKNLKITFEKPEKLLPKTMIDKDKFRQVLMNLVDNAVKYTNKGFIKIKVEEDKLRSGGPFVVISVSDSGIGMNEEERDLIFKRFSRGEQGWKANTSGLGLGLYLAKRIVTDHGGEIWAESKGEKLGSTFFVRLPARVEEIIKEEKMKEFIAKI